MQVLSAIATDRPRTVNTKYGQRTVIDATGPSGELITIWRGGEDASPALRSITNGSRIAVGLDSKGKYSLLEAPADRLPQPISPLVDAPAARPMGFSVTLPMEAETKLRQQMAQAPAPGELSAKVEAIGNAFAQCLTIADGNHTTALALLDRVLAIGF
jgi:hypothetical protein